MLEILFIRHGQTEWNSKRHVMGRRPIPLNETGRSQAEGVAKYLENVQIDVLRASPVERALETARIIASRHKGLDVEQDESFIEIDYGDWVNCTFDELPIKFADEWSKYRTDTAGAAFSGGESMKAAAARITAGVDRLLKMAEVERAVVVAHADVLKIALVHVLGIEMKYMGRFGIDNCAVVLVRLAKDAGPRLIIANTSMGFGRDIRISEAVSSAKS